MRAVVNRVLVVEDDSDLRGFLVEELERDFAVLESASGRDAIALLERVADLAAVVTDLQLGRGPDGFAVLRAARASKPSCARVLVTAAHDVALDEVTSPLVEVVFGKPWIPGTVGAYLRRRLSYD